MNLAFPFLQIYDIIRFLFLLWLCWFHSTVFLFFTFVYFFCLWQPILNFFHLRCHLIWNCQYVILFKHYLGVFQVSIIRQIVVSTFQKIGGRACIHVNKCLRASILLLQYFLFLNLILLDACFRSFAPNQLIFLLTNLNGFFNLLGFLQNVSVEFLLETKQRFEMQSWLSIRQRLTSAPSNLVRLSTHLVNLHFVFVLILSLFNHFKGNLVKNFDSRIPLLILVQRSRSEVLAINFSQADLFSRTHITLACVFYTINIICYCSTSSYLTFLRRFCLSKTERRLFWTIILLRFLWSITYIIVIFV